jgi:hypothetical protein
MGRDLHGHGQTGLSQQEQSGHQEQQGKQEPCIQRLEWFVAVEVGRIEPQPQRCHPVEQRIVGLGEQRREAQLAEPRKGDQSQSLRWHPKSLEREPQRFER